MFQVRFDECAADGAARASTLLRYTIETASAHSSSKGFPMTWYDTHGLYWLVRWVQFELHQPVPYGSRVSVTTQVVGFRRIWARRRNVIRGETGATVGTITMDAVFTDRQGSPVRVVPEIQQAFPALAERIAVQALDLGMRPGSASREDYVVPAHQADARGHTPTRGRRSSSPSAGPANCWEVQVHIRVRPQELRDPLGLVRGEIIQNDVHLFPPRLGRDDVGGEVDMADVVVMHAGVGIERIA